MRQVNAENAVQQEISQIQTTLWLFNVLEDRLRASQPAGSAIAVLDFSVVAELLPAVFQPIQFHAEETPLPEQTAVGPLTFSRPIETGSSIADNKRGDARQ